METIRQLSIIQRFESTGLCDKVEEEHGNQGEIKVTLRFLTLAGRCMMMLFYSARKYQKEINFGC